MDELILRSLRGRATPEEEERLFRWRRLDPENERRYGDVVAVWNLAGEAAPREGKREKPRFEELMIRACASLPHGEDHTGVATVPSRRAGARRFGGVAASLATGAIAASLAGFLFAHLYDAEPDDAARALSMEGEIVTGAGELATVTLADGTSIRLGASSRLRLTRDGSDEIAELEGRAFFGVRSDTTRTFRVRTRSGEAIVHGTRFEVRSEEDEFRVLVVDGRVEVAAAGTAVELGAGGMSRVAPGYPLTASEADDVYEHLGWMGRSLVFQDTPLRRALGEIERRLGLSVLMVDERFAGVTVTATFTDQTVEEVILVLCGMLRAECVVDDGRAIIASSSPDWSPPAHD